MSDPFERSYPPELRAAHQQAAVQAVRRALLDIADLAHPDNIRSRLARCLAVGLKHPRTGWKALPALVCEAGIDACEGLLETNGVLPTFVREWHADDLAVETGIHDDDTEEILFDGLDFADKLCEMLLLICRYTHAAENSPKSVPDDASELAWDGGYLDRLSPVGKTKVKQHLHAATTGLDPADRAARATTGQGVTFDLTDESVVFSWGGRLLSMCERRYLEDDVAPVRLGGTWHTIPDDRPADSE